MEGLCVTEVSLDYAILGFLSQEPASGYDLKRRCFDARAAAFWSADQAQIYRTLDRLRRAKLVSETRARSGRRPERRVFAITDAGKQSLLNWLSTPEPVPSAHDSVALKLHFSDTLRPAARRDLLRAQLERRREHHAWLRHSLSALEADDSLPAETRRARVGALGSVMAQEAGLISALERQLKLVDTGSAAQPMRHRQ